jgi:hypothetical protein
MKFHTKKKEEDEHMTPKNMHPEKQSCMEPPTLESSKTQVKEKKCPST